MLVRQLIGPYAGQLVEMPAAVAQSNVGNGTAAWPDAPLPRVRGMAAAATPEPEAQSEADPEPELERAREDDGTFKADDPATPENEAFKPKRGRGKGKR